MGIFIFWERTWKLCLLVNNKIIDWGGDALPLWLLKKQANISHRVIAHYTWCCFTLGYLKVCLMNCKFAFLACLAGWKHWVKIVIDHDILFASSAVRLCSSSKLQLLPSYILKWSHHNVTMKVIACLRESTRMVGWRACIYNKSLTAE